MFGLLRGLKKFDWILLVIALLLFSTGIAVIYSTTHGVANGKEALEQGIFGVAGIVAFGLVSFFDYRTFKNVSGILYIITIILLLIVLIMGFTSLGATRWFKIGPFTVQPAEFAKLFMIISMAKYFSERAEQMHKFKNLIISGLYFLIPAGLVAIQPDLGTALVFFVIWAAMVLVSSVRLKHVLVLVVAVLIAMPIGWQFLHDYQKDRIITFLEPAGDPTGTGYNVNQALIAVGSGQFWGRGLGHGSQSQLNFIPEKHTDFIFAALGEEMGFMGSFIVIALFFALIIRGILIAAKSQDYFGMYLAVGGVAMIAFHTFLNIGMNLGIAPVAGIPLPLISLGGTSVLVVFVILGLMESVHIHRKRLDFE